MQHRFQRWLTHCSIDFCYRFFYRYLVKPRLFFAGATLDPVCLLPYSSSGPYLIWPWHSAPVYTSGKDVAPTSSRIRNIIVSDAPRTVCLLTWIHQRRSSLHGISSMVLFSPCVLRLGLWSHQLFVPTVHFMFNLSVTEFVFQGAAGNCYRIRKPQDLCSNG